MKRILKFIVPSALLFFLISNVLRDWSLVQSSFSQSHLGVLAFAFMVSLFVYPEGAYAWKQIVEAIDGQKSFRKVFYVWAISNTSRYIPGTIWQYVGRVELAKKKINLSRKTTLFSIFTEMSFTLIAAGLIIICTFPLWSFIHFESTWILLLLPVPLIVLHPSSLSFFSYFLSRFTKREFFAFQTSISLEKTFEIVPWYAINFLINGVALYLLISAFIGPQTISSLILYIGYYTLSWTVGYLTLIAPGGLGAADASLTFLLSFSMPLPMAAFIAIMYRILLTVSELLVFLVAIRINDE